MDTAIAQHLSPKVEAALKQVLAGAETDAFDAPDFDVFAFINGRYGSESSLSTLSNTIAAMDAEIAQLDESILETVRVQSTAGRTASRDLGDAKASITDLAVTVAEIKRRAEASEKLVTDICRDIRQLDVAKKHLTASINALARLQTLSEAVGDLLRHSDNRNYEESAPLLEACISLFGHLSEYRDIPKVSELANNVEKIRDSLRESATADFDILLEVVTPQSLAYEEAAAGAVKQLRLNSSGQLAAEGESADEMAGPRELSEDNIYTLKAICDVVDALGPKDRRTLIRAFNRKQLKPYANVFRRGTEVGDSLMAVERRFGWFRRSLREIEHRFGGFLPPHWAVQHRLCVDFCEATRMDIERILSQYDPPSSAPADMLIRALRATQAFEKEMTRKFDNQSKQMEDTAHGSGFDGQEAEEVVDEAAPLYNERGQLIDPMSAEGIRIKYARRKEAKDRKEEEKARKAAKEEKRRWIAGLAGEDSSAVAKDDDVASLPKIYEKGKGGLISNCFELYMGAYIHFERQSIENQVMAALAEDFAPGVERPASANLLRSASILFVESRNAINRGNQLGIATLALSLYKEIKEAFASYIASLETRVPKPIVLPPNTPALPGDNFEIPDVNGPTIVEHLSLIITTAAYCAETLPQLAETIRKIVDEQYKESIEFDTTADEFLNLQTSTIKTMASVVAYLLDGPLNTLSKTQWEKVTEVGDQSPYVADLGRLLRLLMSKVKCKRDDAAFRSFCDKFARAFIARYQSAIFRCKKVGEMGAQQLLLDAQGLRSILLAAPTARGAGDRASSTVDDDEDLRAATDEEVRDVGLVMYTKTINRDLPRVEMLFKIMAAPKDRFADTMKALWPDAAEKEVARVLELKGLNKKDAAECMAALGFGKSTTGTTGIGSSIGMGGMGMGGMGMGGMANAGAGFREGGAKVFGGMEKFLKAATTAVTKK